MLKDLQDTSKPAAAPPEARAKFPFSASINGRSCIVHEETIEYTVCPDCGGDGWYVDHDIACYEAGECIGCSGVQVQCRSCVA